MKVELIDAFKWPMDWPRYTSRCWELAYNSRESASAHTFWDCEPLRLALHDISTTTTHVERQYTVKMAPKKHQAQVKTYAALSILSLPNSSPTVVP